MVCHKVQHSDPLRPYVDKMVEGFPAVRGVQFESNRTSSPIPPSQSQRSELHGMNASLPLGSSRTGTGTTLGGRKHSMDGLVPNVITEKYLADLHARIKRALRMSDRWNAYVSQLKCSVISLSTRLKVLRFCLTNKLAPLQTFQIVFGATCKRQDSWLRTFRRTWTTQKSKIQFQHFFL